MRLKDGEHDEFSLDAIERLPETETRGLKNTFCCPYHFVTQPTTA